MLQPTMESLEIACGTMDSVDEPAIDDSAAAALWTQWRVGVVKWSELNAVLKQSSIVCPQGLRFVKTAAMMKHFVANQ